MVFFQASHAHTELLEQKSGLPIAIIRASISWRDGGRVYASRSPCQQSGRIIIHLLCCCTGTHSEPSKQKSGFHLPRLPMSNPDLARLINSDEIQSVVNPPKSGPVRRPRLRRNPLKNLGALLKLNPYAKTARRMEIVAHVRSFSLDMTNDYLFGSDMIISHIVMISSWKSSSLLCHDSLFGKNIFSDHNKAKYPTSSSNGSEADAWGSEDASSMRSRMRCLMTRATALPAAESGHILWGRSLRPNSGSQCITMNAQAQLAITMAVSIDRRLLGIWASAHRNSCGHSHEAQFFCLVGHSTCSSVCQAPSAPVVIA